MHYSLQKVEAYLYLGPRISNNFTTAAFSRTNAAALRRWSRVPFLAWVTIFSANIRISLALAVVVIILSCLISDVTMFLIMAKRCVVSLPSLRNEILFLILN